MKTRSPWTWVPTLYFAEGIPNVAVVTISAIMFQKFGMSNGDIGFYTSWLYLPWAIKFLWSPFVDLFKSKRWWIVTMQLILGACMAGIALSLPGPQWFQYSMGFFWLLSFSSATHDIAADGFYMYGLNDKNQAFFVGIRSTFYRIAMISGQGLLVILAGKLEKSDLPTWAHSLGNIPYSWMVTFGLMAIMFVGFGIYHQFMLPKPQNDRLLAPRNPKDILKEFWLTFYTFFQKKNSVMAVVFLLLYRFSEAQLLKINQLFLLDERGDGGLGMSTLAVGTTYGIVGVIALIAGGIIGGIVISRDGLKKWIWPMVLSLTMPNITSIYFAYAQPESLWLINAGIAFEQFGYGFGFSAYMVFMLQFAKGLHQTAHYAICTGFMAVGMMLPGMVAGDIQEYMGYQHFFIYVMICALVPILLVKFLYPKLEEKRDPDGV